MGKTKELKLRHIDSAHSSVSNLTIFQNFTGSECARCPEIGCGKIFDSLANLGRHQGQRKGTSCYAIWRAQKDSQDSEVSQDSANGSSDGDDQVDDESSPGRGVDL
jgi:hypothetical protein